MNKKLQLNSKFEFNNNFFFISPLLHEYSFFDPRWGPGSLEAANIAKAAAQRDVGKDRKDLGGNCCHPSWGGIKNSGRPFRPGCIAQR